MDENPYVAPETASSAPAADNPRLPADLGLGGLGLVMLLSGGIFVCFNVLLISIFLLAGMFDGRGGGFGGLAVILIVLSGLIRSSIHAGAGGQLVSGSPGALRFGVTYGLVGLAQTVLVLVLLNSASRGGPGGGFMGGGLKGLLPLGLVMAAWPVAVLGLILRPRVKELLRQLADGDARPQTLDRGIEGVGALMVGLAGMGTLFGLIMLLGLLQAKVTKGGLPGIMTLLVALTLVARSITHLVTGVRALGGPHPIDFRRIVGSYQTAAWISVAAVAALGLVLMVLGPGRSGPGPLFLFGSMAGMLAVWPVGVSLATRQTFDIEAVEPQGGEALGRARDGGLCTLGYLIVALGTMAVAQGLGTVFSGTASQQLLGLEMLAGRRGVSAAAVGQTAGSTWMALGVGAVTLWAGIELILMSARYRIAAIAYGLVAGVHAVYSSWPLLKTITSARMEGGVGAAGANPIGIFMAYGGVALALVIPVVTLVLANRPLPALESTGVDAPPPGIGAGD